MNNQRLPFYYETHYVWADHHTLLIFYDYSGFIGLIPAGILAKKKYPGTIEVMDVLFYMQLKNLHFPVRCPYVWSDWYTRNKHGSFEPRYNKMKQLFVACEELLS